MNRPSIIRWYRLYCGLMAFIYLFVVGLGAAMIWNPQAWVHGEQTPETVLFVGGFLILLTGTFLIAYAVSYFLPPKPWTWIYHLILICIGFTSCLTLPFSLFLLMAWIKPETKQYFGRS